MLCPEGKFRKTLCYTYISPLFNAKRKRSIFYIPETYSKIPKLKELYDANPILFGVLLFIDLMIFYFIIQWIIS